MQEDLVRWERAIEEGIDIPSEIKAESDSYRLSYDELIKICTLSEKHDQDYYDVCSNPRFWKEKMEYDISQSDMTHHDFFMLSLEKGYTIYVGILLKSSPNYADIITSSDIYKVILNGYYNIIKLLLSNIQTRSLFTEPLSDDVKRGFFVTKTRFITNAVDIGENEIAFLLMNNLELDQEDYVKILRSALTNSILK